MGEVAPTAIRGPLLGCWQLRLSVSQRVAACINHDTESMTTTAPYCIPTAVQLIFPLLVLAFLWWVQESPRWLLRRSKDTKCDVALRLLHKEDNSYTTQADMTTIRSSLAAEAEQTAESSWLDLLKDPVERRKLIYSAGALNAQQINSTQWFYYFWHRVQLSHWSEGFVPDEHHCLHHTNRYRHCCSSLHHQNPETTASLDCKPDHDGQHLHFRLPRHSRQQRQFNIWQIHHQLRDHRDYNFQLRLGAARLDNCKHRSPMPLTNPHTHDTHQASEMAVDRNRNKIYAVAVACFWIIVWATVFTLPYLYYSTNLGPKTGFVNTGLCFITLAYV